MRNYIYVILLVANVAIGQKLVYIPLFLQDTSTNEGSQFSTDKTAQSDNFVLIWGNAVGTNPDTVAGDLHFDPAAILGTMEYIYSQFKVLGFLDDSDGTNLHTYKIPIIMYNTWGPGGIEGYANGGDADGVIGAFWVHPVAMQTGDVAAHELTHSLQAQAVIDARSANGLGAVWNNAGIFWETHANFMRNLLYPQDVTAWGMDVYHVETLGDWKNTYENYEFLIAIMESDGIDIINRLWRESMGSEYPLQAYKRLSGYNQQEFNDKMFGYAKRMATHDFTYNNIGDYLRQYRAADLTDYLPSVQATWTILRQVQGSETRFEVPVEIAPEEYAYNIIPLYPDDASCSVIIKFKGHTELNTHAGWRYGFVAAHPDGTISRYGEMHSAATSELAFALEGGESEMYLVVMGAPVDNIQTNPENDTWHGYPKHFRYPYELNITGAKPEGFQNSSQFRGQLKSGGHNHINGAGWVQNSASVASTVYVAPSAIVMGNANISGLVRIENTALVNNASLSGNVVVKDNAFVNGGTYSGDAIISGQSFVENAAMTQQSRTSMRARVTNYDLSGNIEVGGDVVVYNENGACDNGVYYRLTNYYEDNLLECDGRDASHPANADVNLPYLQFSDAEMAMACNCGTLPGCLSLAAGQFMAGQNRLVISPNPASSIINLKLPDGAGIAEITIYGALGNIALRQKMAAPAALDISGLTEGFYMVRAVSADGRSWNATVVRKK